MLEKVIQPAAAFFLKDLRTSVRSPRLAVASLVLAAITLLASWALGQGVLSAQEEDQDQTSAPVWKNGPDGALTALAFGVMPLLLPIIPIVLVHRNLLRDLSGGLFQLAVSRPVPKLGMALGKLGGLFVALAVPLVPLSLASAFLIQGIAGTPIDPNLVAGFVGSNIVLGALYLLLSLLIGTLLSARNVPALSLLAWVGFNTLSPTAFLLIGGTIGAFEPPGGFFFSYMWTDAASFTGLYHGLIATFVPNGLGFVVWPDPANSAAALVPLVVQWAIVPWVVALSILYIIPLGRVPTR